MATKPDDDKKTPPKMPAKTPPKKRGDGPIRTQMVGEHGDDDLGYDPSIIPTEKIADDD